MHYTTHRIQKPFIIDCACFSFWFVRGQMMEFLSEWAMAGNYRKHTTWWDQVSSHSDLNWLDFDPYEPPTFVVQVEGSVRNNFRVLSETKIVRLGRVKRKERPYATQLSKTYRTELNLEKPNLNRLEWLEIWSYHVVLFL